MNIQSLARAASASLLIGLVATPAQAQWHVDVASWNLLNFGDHKSGIIGGGKNNLLDRMASIISRYDIVFVQEVLNGGGSLTNALAQRAQLANYNCQTVSQPSGWAGRPERYGVCWNTMLPLTLQGQFDFVGQQATSLNGNQYNAVNLWMRPPLRATFRYTKPDGTFFDFTVYNIHTKPAYSVGGQRPQGVAPAPARNRSVFTELSLLERNVVPAPNVLLLGDFNADCAYLTQADEGNVLTGGNGWTWVVPRGTKTNTAAGSACAYDRVVLNGGAQATRLGWGVDYVGVNATLDGRRVSDHYPVWTRLGQHGPISTPPRIKAVITQVAPGGVTKKMKVDISGLPQTQTSVQAQLFLASSGPLTGSLRGGRTVPLQDARGSPTPVTIKPDGSINPLLLDLLKPGAYTLVLDRDRDGQFIRGKGDFANGIGGIDIVLPDQNTPRAAALNDSGRPFSDAKAEELGATYVLARGVRPDADHTLCVVSSKRLQEVTKGNNNASVALTDVAVPVHHPGGPIAQRRIALSDIRVIARSDGDGTLFAALWRQPSMLFNSRVDLTAPQPSAWKEAQALDDDTATEADDDPTRDTCAKAAQSSDADLQAVCNIGPFFANAFGNEFIMLLDSNNDGKLDPGDPRLSTFKLTN